MRLDKFIASQLGLTRNDAKKEIKKGKVSINNEPIKNPDYKVSETSDTVKYDGNPVIYEKHVYFLLNKPAGVISATEDNLHKTVIDLINNDDKKPGLHPVGRLDIDTEGLLIITNDGAFSHNMLSPTKHVNKAYFARLKGIPTKDDINKFKEGIDIGTVNEPEICKPAKLEIINTDNQSETSEVLITISEGKYHQVKRMAHVIGCEVTYLKRISMGNFSLPEDLKLGEYIRIYPT